MALQKSQKEKIVKDLEQAVAGSESLVFVNFKSLHVGEETKLRKDLRDKGVTYKVSRKTLLRRALQGKAEGEIPELPGEVAGVGFGVALRTHETSGVPPDFVTSVHLLPTFETVSQSYWTHLPESHCLNRSPAPEALTHF